MRALAKRSEDQFVERVEAHLRRALPHVCAEMDTGAMRSSVNRGMQKARDYRILTEYDTVRFIDLMYTLGFEFDRELTWAHDILTDLQIPADMRLNMIDDHLDDLEQSSTEVHDA